MGLILPFRPNKLNYPGTSPGINPAHPASNWPAALHGYFASAVPSGANFINLANAAKGAPSGAAASNSSIVGPVVSGNTTLIVNPTGVAPTTITLGAIFVMPGATFAGNQGIVALNTNLLITIDGSNSTQLNVYNGTSFDTGIFASLSTPYFVACSVSGATLNFVLTNLQTGQVFSVVNPSFSSISYNQDPLYLGATGFGSPFNGTVAAGMVSTAFLNLQQLLQWANDPWSFWYPNKLDLADMLTVAANVPGLTILPAGRVYM